MDGAHKVHDSNKKVKSVLYLALLLQGLLVQYDFNISFSENSMGSVVL